MGMKEAGSLDMLEQMAGGMRIDERCDRRAPPPILGGKCVLGRVVMV